jgi:hypothetical protein
MFRGLVPRVECSALNVPPATASVKAYTLSIHRRKPPATAPTYTGQDRLTPPYRSSAKSAELDDGHLGNLVSRGRDRET